jgi:hypothetical protein
MQLAGCGHTITSDQVWRWEASLRQEKTEDGPCGLTSSSGGASNGD